jgi:glycosyltransferase involved in cell wall biosynthesis
VTAIVCAYNAEGYIEECLRSLTAIDYPTFEIIVCDDGSNDRTLELARRFPVRVLELDRGGLSRARNAGIEAASGEIVAFIDSDAYAHCEWPYHLALSLEGEAVEATGGPNLAVREVGLAERVVAASPGAPMHVLITDDRAEHVPGCNMAYRKSVFEDVGGFDPVYTAAGDDVDLCWKVLDGDKQIAFTPAAQVRHHRRDTIKGYLKQQRGYGKAERLVAARHPQRFNRLGQARWGGFIYGGARLLPAVLRPIIYHGYHGLSPYQGVVIHRSEVALAWATALLPLVVPVVAIDLAVSFLVGIWPLATMAAIVGMLALGGAIAATAKPSPVETKPLKYRLLVGAMYVLQPFVRTWGRLRAPRHAAVSSPWKPWNGDRSSWLRSLSGALTARRASVSIGGPNDAWDLEVTIGPLVAYRLTTAVLWGWTPVVKRRIHARLHGLVLAVLVTGVTVIEPGLGAILAAILAATCIAEVWFLKRALDQAIEGTTEEARAS